MDRLEHGFRVRSWLATGYPLSKVNPPKLRPSLFPYIYISYIYKLSNHLKSGDIEGITTGPPETLPILETARLRPQKVFP
jgi:hypothetical protein